MHAQDQSTKDHQGGGENLLSQPVHHQLNPLSSITI